MKQMHPMAVKNPRVSFVEATAKPLKPKILLVEDTPLCARVARVMLESLGFQVESASTGQEAASVFNETFSAVLLDIGLPDIDGYTVCQKIRATENSKHRVPIIACTAFDLCDVREQCLLAGMNDVMNKPTSMQALQEKLSIFIDVKNSNQESACLC